MLCFPKVGSTKKPLETRGLIYIFIKMILRLELIFHTTKVHSANGSVQCSYIDMFCK